MGDFDDVLNSILSNPGDMEKIMDLARELSGGRPEPREPEGGEGRSPAAPDLEGLSPGMLSAMAKLLGQFRQKDDGKAALIASMKPFVRPERREALDLARTAVNELGGEFDLGL